MPESRITLLSKPGCHLCDDAREVIVKVSADLDVGWDERDINASEHDLREYWDKIPVTLVDGVEHDFWRVSESRLRSALAAPRRLAGQRAAAGRESRPHPAQGNSKK